MSAEPGDARHAFVALAVCLAIVIVAIAAMGPRTPRVEPEPQCDPTRHEHTPDGGCIGPGCIRGSCEDYDAYRRRKR